MKKTFILALLFLFLFGNLHAVETEDCKCLGKSTAFDVLYEHYPPDPVNTRTGNFYLPIQDIYLPCFGIPLEVFRAYNSFSKRKGPFGIGWTFNYEIKISLGSVGVLTVVEPDGFINEYSSEKKGSQFKGETIDKIMAARKEEDRKYLNSVKSDDFYDKIRIKLSSDEDYFKRMKKRYLPPEKVVISDGVYVSYKRGISTLIKKDGLYTRIRQNGRKEFYNSEGILTKVEDRNGNSLHFELDDKGRVKKVSDGCNHYVLITYNTRELITKIIDSLGRTLLYEYDSSNRLISSSTVDKKKVKYTYSKSGLLVMITDEEEQKIYIKYDKRNRTIEQRGPDRKITKYTYGRKGKDYQYAIVKDNQGYFEKLEFYPEKRKTVQHDSKGNKVITIIDRTCNKPARVVDSNGNGERYEYNSDGDLIKKKDSSGNIVSYQYDPKVNLISEITDQRGNKLKFLYDPRGNLTYANLAKEGWVKIRYEKHGKVQSLADSKGNIVSFTYTYFGMPKTMNKKFKGKNVGTMFVKYTPLGEIDSVSYKPNDTRISEDIKKTINSILELLRPSGIDFRI